MTALSEYLNRSIGGGGQGPPGSPAAYDCVNRNASTKLYTFMHLITFRKQARISWSWPNRYSYPPTKLDKLDSSARYSDREGGRGRHHRQLWNCSLNGPQIYCDPRLGFTPMSLSPSRFYLIPSLCLISPLLLHGYMVLWIATTSLSTLPRGNSSNSSGDTLHLRNNATKNNLQI